jgi:hypothetical protein
MLKPHMSLIHIAPAKAFSTNVTREWLGFGVRMNMPHPVLLAAESAITEWTSQKRLN